MATTRQQQKSRGTYAPRGGNRGGGVNRGGRGSHGAKGRGGSRGRGGRGRGSPRGHRLNVTVTTPPAPTGPTVHDLLLGDYSDKLQTSQQLRDFQEKGVRRPGKLMMVKCNTKLLTLTQFDDKKIKIRNIIVRLKSEFYQDMLAMADVLADTDNHPFTDNELIAVKNNIESELTKVKNHYKPARIFIVIEHHGPFAGILSMIARKNGYVQALMNQVGKKQLEEYPEGEVRSKKFCKRLGYYLLYQHPFSRDVNEFSNDKVLFIDEL